MQFWKKCGGESATSVEHLKHYRCNLSMFEPDIPNNKELA